MIRRKFDYSKLPPERKLEIIKQMGFTAFFEDHQPDCSALYASGIRCICVPPGTSFGPPRDVREHLHETRSELIAKKGAQ